MLESVVIEIDDEYVDNNLIYLRACLKIKFGPIISMGLTHKN
ncbi:MAG: hypothetical protein ACP5N0_03200 [Methanosarcina sp.]